MLTKVKFMITIETTIGKTDAKTSLSLAHKIFIKNPNAKIIVIKKQKVKIMSENKYGNRNKTEINEP